MCHHHLEDKLFEDLPSVPALDGHQNTLIYWLNQRCNIGREELGNNFSICGDELFFVGIGRAVVEQEHGFGFKTHLSQLLLHSRDKLMMEPVCEQSYINPSI